MSDTASLPTLYVGAASSCSDFALIALLQLGKEPNKDFKLETVDWAKMKKEPYLSKQPFGKVPAYEDSRVKFYESRAIARYVIELFEGPGSSLLPQNLEEKAYFEQWASLETTTYAEPISTVIFHRIWYQYIPNFVVSEEEVGKAVKTLENHFSILNAKLNETKFVVFNRLCLVDLLFAPSFHYLEKTAEGKLLISKYANISRWWNDMKQSAGFKKLAALRYQH